jgi:hypothetical protein
MSSHKAFPRVSVHLQIQRYSHLTTLFFALSRQKRGFESPRERQGSQCLSENALGRASDFKYLGLASRGSIFA